MKRTKRTWAVQVYRVALRALPRRVRDGSGAEMIDTFQRLHARARARGALASLIAVAGEAFDVVTRGVALRIGALPAGPALGTTLRRLVRRPVYAIAVVTTLALGVGASSAMFAVVRTVVLRPLPVHEPDRLANAWRNTVGELNPTPGTTSASFLAWRRIDDLFTGVEGFARDQGVLTAPGPPEQIRTAVVTPGLFDLLGVSPALGRTFQDPEGRPGDADWALIAWELWARRFGSDPAVLGRTVELDRRSLTIVGIMPRGLDFPEPGTEVWLPVAPTPAALTPDVGSPPVAGLDVLVRMRPGLDMARANELLEARAEEIEAAGATPGEVPWLLGLDEMFTTPERTREALVLLFGGVLLVLMIAGANVTSLGLSHAVDRRGELSIRRALGAGTPRMVGELFAENVAVAILGGGLGLLLAEGLLRGLTPLLPDQLGIRTWGQELTAWPDALPFAGLAAIVVAGTMTALTLVRGVGSVRAVDAAGRAGTEAPGSLRLQQALIVGQLALAVLLLSGSTLVARSVLRLEANDTGFDSDRLLAVSLRIPTGMMMSDERSSELFDARFDEYGAALAAVPGVRSVASTTSPLPLTRARFRPILETGEGATTSVGDFLPMNEIDESFFETAGIGVLEGRGFGESDDPASVIIVNDELARRLWPEGGAVGRRLRVMENDPWRTVVGVVESTAQMGLRDPWGEGAEIHIPLDRTRFGVYRTFLVRAERVAPAALGPAVRDAVWAVDPLQPIERLLPLEAAFSDSIARERFFLALIGAFALMAAILAGCGTYAILSRSLGRRAREIGIRTALGARPGRILLRVARTAFGPALVGIVLGIVAAWPASRALEALLYEVEPGDPVSLVITVVALVAVVTLAAIGPARRALRTDVVEALRSE